MSKKYFTDYLFPRTNYLIGAGSIFNLAGNYFEFNYVENADADNLAIATDWGVIGKDLEDTINSNPVELLQIRK